MVASWLVARLPGGEVTGYPSTISGKFFLDHSKSFWTSTFSSSINVFRIVESISMSEDIYFQMLSSILSRTQQKYKT